MKQGARVTETWAEEPPVANEEAIPAEPIDDVWAEAPTAQPPRWPAVLIGALLVLLAAAWIGGLGWALAQATPPGALQPLRLAAWIGLASAPLALLATLYLLLLRTGRLDARAYGRAAGQLRADTQSLRATLHAMNRQIADARRDLAGHADELARLGTDTGARLTQAAGALDTQSTALARTAAALDDATATARADLGVLLSDLPRAETIARAVGDGLRQSGVEADIQARALAQLLEQVEAQARAAGEAGDAAASRLTIQLDRIAASASTADRGIADTAESMGRAVDAALAAAADGVEQTRHAIATQSAALTAMVEQSRATLVATGEDAVAALSARIEALLAKVDGLGTGLHGQDAAARALFAQLDAAIGTVEARFAALGETSAEQAGSLNDAILTISDHADALGRTLGGSNQLADTLLGRVSQLREQAGASSVALSDTIPAALARIRFHAEHSLQAITAAGQRSDALAAAAETISERLADADSLLDRQRTTLDEVGARADSRLQGLREQTQALEEMLRRADAEIHALSEGASGKLVEALNQVRETATRASDQARDALSAAIPRVAQRLGESASRAMTAAMADVGKAEMASIGAASEEAIEAARLATERLTRQLLTIAETSTAIQARIDANARDTEAHDDQSFARTAGLLIEALNSTAIDVAKIFSNEVSDDEWKAYLRGDRGIFTRRAVRLIDRAEAQAIVQRYHEDGEFHDQVNRYVHDFEALIRRVMAIRQGMPIATALLSSDTGKLYVALAQAIERLRK
jgi:hypothetical protein